MKTTSVTDRWLAVTVWGALAAACSVHVGTDSRPRSAAPPPPARPSPPPPAPAPPPPAPPRAIGRTPAPRAQPPVSSPTAATGAPASSPSGPAAYAGLAVHPTGPGTSFFQEALNLRKLGELKARNPKACGMHEVAPGNFVRIDCHAYQPALKAIAHLSPRKAKFAAARQLFVKPSRLFGAARNFMVAPTPGAPVAPGAAGERAAGDRGGAGDVRADSLPGAVDHRAENLEGPIKDQGPVGSCTAFSLSSTLDNQAIRAGKMAGNSREQAASPNHVWSAYGVPQMGTAADANVGRTIATMGLWPKNNVEACKLASAFYDSECGFAFEPAVVAGSWRADQNVVAKYDRANASPSYKIGAIEKLQTLPPNLDELVQTLASGSDLWIAMKIDGYAWSNSKMKNGVIPDWDSPTGGHAVEMAGYRDTPAGRQFLIHNSWGTSWGDGGYAWVSEHMVHKYMHYAYKVRLEGGVKKEDLTDDDCSPDDLVDSATGECAPICEDGSRPQNGCSVSGKRR